MPNPTPDMRGDQFNVNANFDGADFGFVTTRTGGQMTSEDTKFKPGSMTPEVSLGGPTTVENIVLTAPYDAFHRAAAPALLENSRVGRATAVITQHSMDREGQVIGTSLVWRGRLIRVQLPEYDASSSDAAMVEYEVAPDSTVSVT